MSSLFLVVALFLGRSAVSQPVGTVGTIAGSALGYADGRGTSSLFNKPWGVALPANGSFALIVRTDG